MGLDFNNKKWGTDPHQKSLPELNNEIVICNSELVMIESRLRLCWVSRDSRCEYTVLYMNGTSTISFNLAKHPTGSLCCSFPRWFHLHRPPKCPQMRRSVLPEQQSSKQGQRWQCTSAGSGRYIRNTHDTNKCQTQCFISGGVFFFVNSAAVTFLLFLCVPFVHCGHINTCAMWIMTIKITTMAFVWQQKPCFDNQYTADFNALEQKIPQLQWSHFMLQSRTSEVEHSPADSKLMHTKSSL